MEATPSAPLATRVTGPQLHPLWTPTWRRPGADPESIFARFQEDP